MVIFPACKKPFRYFFLINKKKLIQPCRKVMETSKKIGDILTIRRLKRCSRNPNVAIQRSNTSSIRVGEHSHVLCIDDDAPPMQVKALIQVPTFFFFFFFLKQVPTFLNLEKTLLSLFSHTQKQMLMNKVKLTQPIH